MFSRTAAFIHSAETITVTVCANPASGDRLRAIFETAPGLALAGSVSAPEHLAVQWRAYPADVVVAVSSVEGLVEWRRALADLSPAPALVALTPEAELEQARALANTIDISIVSDRASTDALAAAVRAAALGLKVIPRRTTAFVRSNLTVREREVLGMLADGLSNKEISRRLTISANTTKFHVSGILDKLGAGTRAEAVAIALRGGALAR